MATNKDAMTNTIIMAMNAFVTIKSPMLLRLCNNGQNHLNG